MPRPDDPHILDVVELLLQHGAVKHIDGYHRHNAPISNAAAAGAPKLVKLLLAYGTDADGGDRELRSSFQYPLLTALRKWHNKEIVSALLGHGCNPNAAYSDGRTALHLCASNFDHPSDMIELLLSQGSRVNTPAADGSTPLHDAARANNLCAMKALLDNGSFVDALDEQRRSPVMVAAELENFQAIQMLREHGTAIKGIDWEIACSSPDKVKILRHPAIRMPRNDKDVFEVYWMLLTCSTKSGGRPLTRAIIVRILEFACYWPCQTWSRDDLIEYDQDQTALGVPYILTGPLQLGNRHSIREVAFITRSHDQGSSNHSELQGTYEGSYTWFEVAIQKADGSWHDFGTDDPRIIINVHGSNQVKEHCAEYGHCWPKMQCQWLDTLEQGDRIAVLAKARFLGWVNFVHSVRIELLTACIVKSPRDSLVNAVALQG
ncbi:ankyrin [Corynespora cassiicola Philippines]|uniref:Ankyrin n=1 Tax=Corynespora cassiicola Philippines TaxID=1448308 RepID=A0A2T2NYH9_CORCC|nr:ankyrin [Corynespora cassiicola Philippines]